MRWCTLVLLGIVVDQNPLDNILSLQDVLLVVNDGKVVADRLSFALE